MSYAVLVLPGDSIHPSDYQDNIQLPRIFKHREQAISFIHQFIGEEIEWKSQLPEEWKNLAYEIRSEVRENLKQKNRILYEYDDSAYHIFLMKLKPYRSMENHI